MRKLGAGRGLLQGLVLRGHAQPTRPRQEGRQDDQRPSAAGAQLLHPPSDQRLQRGDEQPHPRSDQAGQWISQPRAPQTRPVLSSRKPRHAPNHAVKITRKTRKDHISVVFRSSRLFFVFRFAGLQPLLELALGLAKSPRKFRNLVRTEEKSDHGDANHQLYKSRSHLTLPPYIRKNAKNGKKVHSPPDKARTRTLE